MAGVSCCWDVPWCFGGDFNITRFPNKRVGDTHFSHAMTIFSDLIFKPDLIDLQMAGGDFTWSNGRAWSRLNRFLVSACWEACFPDLSQKRLLRMCSDHYPIMLDCGGIIRGHRYFKFENMWLEEEGFVDRVRSWWSSHSFSGTPSFVLASKLKALKQDLKKWNVEEFRIMENERKLLLQQLKSLVDSELLGDISNEELERKKEVVAELLKITLMEEIYWSQKSRVLWLKEGDKCTKIFH
ncbi:hypothetical protein CIPAW_10G107700 [Carya illinoinensis]|uniref:Uncharacterized protein n=1 Tax=Carya illinoinensis TaxID=32201 RepID=A0A8T1PEL5_CARIL|nr:hypothetical protein CIPAW_10G107700 [Carya illinoinensis]